MFFFDLQHHIWSLAVYFCTISCPKSSPVEKEREKKKRFSDDARLENVAKQSCSFIAFRCTTLSQLLPGVCTSPGGQTQNDSVQWCHGEKNTNSYLFIHCMCKSSERDAVFSQETLPVSESCQFTPDRCSFSVCLCKNTVLSG